MENFESLAMVLIDKDFDGEAFDMDTYYFAEDLLPKKKRKADEEETRKHKRRTQTHSVRFCYRLFLKKNVVKN